MNGNEAHNASPASSSSGLANRATFATSSTDFALPFGPLAVVLLVSKQSRTQLGPRLLVRAHLDPHSSLPDLQCGRLILDPASTAFAGHLASSPSRFASSATGLGIGMLPRPRRETSPTRWRNRTPQRCMHSRPHPRSRWREKVGLLRQLQRSRPHRPHRPVALQLRLLC